MSDLHDLCLQFVATVGDDPHNRVAAVEQLVKILTGCTETTGLVGDAMQPWLEDQLWSNRD